MCKLLGKFQFQGSCSYTPGAVTNFLLSEAVVQKCSCTRVFFDKAAGWEPANLLRKRLRYMCFPVNFEKFLRTPIS